MWILRLTFILITIHNLWYSVHATVSKQNTIYRHFAIVLNYSYRGLKLSYSIFNNHKQKDLCGQQCKSLQEYCKWLEIFEQKKLKTFWHLKMTRDLVKQSGQKLHKETWGSSLCLHMNMAHRQKLSDESKLRYFLIIFDKCQKIGLFFDVTRTNYRLCAWNIFG